MVTRNLKKCSASYYANKISSIEDIFGTDNIVLKEQVIIINGHSYPVVDDVIILLDPVQYPASLSKLLSSYTSILPNVTLGDFAEDIQFTFGAEWLTYPKILPEHEEEFSLYFDILDTSTLESSRVCDLGCGIGRWSYFLKDKCRELILVDFSEAIFAARKNLKESSNAIFFMGDLKRLPFKKDFADILFCLGVLHHLPVDALKEVVALKKYAPTILIYLYYALDNRPPHFRVLLKMVTLVRVFVARVKNPSFRNCFSSFIAYTVYLPLVYLGKLMKTLGLSQQIPLFEGYDKKTVKRIEQDVYDRFFTRIEQRVTKKQILELEKDFSEVTISDNIPYWHFKCETKPAPHDK
jgi:SAM-dependent methyltransferase